MCQNHYHIAGYEENRHAPKQKQGNVPVRISGRPEFMGQPAGALVVDDFGKILIDPKFNRRVEIDVTLIIFKLKSGLTIESF